MNPLEEFIRWCRDVPHPNARVLAERFRDMNPRVLATFRARWRAEDEERAKVVALSERRES